MTSQEVVDTLKNAYRINCDVVRSGFKNFDRHLLESFDRTIQYYSTLDQYTEWCEERNKLVEEVNKKLHPFDRI